MMKMNLCLHSKNVPQRHGRMETLSEDGVPDAKM